MKTRYIPMMIGAALVTMSVGVAYGAGGDAASGATADTSAGGTPKQQDHALAKSVRHALYTTKGLTSSGITVLARNGTVSLSGMVPDQAQIALAGSAAQSVAGVTSVKNNVLVSEKN